MTRARRSKAVISGRSVSTDEEELIEQFPLTARVFINQLKKTYEEKDKHFKAKEKLSHILTADANSRYLKVSGDLCLRRILEESEKDEMFVAVKKDHKAKQKDSKKKSNEYIPNLSRKEIWSNVLNDCEECKDRFPQVYLLNRNLPVAGLLADLFNFSSKEVHTHLPCKVFIDKDNYTPEQVLYIIFKHLLKHLLS